jgi:Flp pilus assembly protein CpaB
LDIASPRAHRLRRPRWYDGRLLGGLTLLLASVVAGSAVVGAAGRTVPVWAVRRSLPAGTQLQPDDLVARRVRLYDGAAARYLDADRPLPAGATLRRDVGAGELLPLGAVSTADTTKARRVVSVPITRAHALGGELERGMKIDVVATYTSPGGRATTVPVLRSVTVVGLTRPPSGFAAGKAELGVLVEVSPEQALALAAAGEAAAIDVLRVVPGSDGDGDIGSGPYRTEPAPR